MRLLFTALAICLTPGRAVPQAAPVVSVKQVGFVDDAGQKIAFAIPTTWKYAGGVIYNAQGAKVGEFTPGTIAGCRHRTGADYLKELKAGYPDDPGDTRFVGSRVLTVGGQQWVEGVRNVEAWDGVRNDRRWYTHSFFAIINRKCFEITFYSRSRQLPEQAVFESILGSIKLL